MSHGPASILVSPMAAGKNARSGHNANVLTLPMSFSWPTAARNVSSASHRLGQFHSL